MHSPSAQPQPESSDFNRRDFLKGSSTATLMAVLGGTPIVAPWVQAADPAPAGEAFNIGVIGCGAWGRDILNTLSRIPTARIAAVCDSYPVMLRRAKEPAPDARQYADYTELLANPDIPAVIIATPSHQHKDIAIAALKAGKHVYCEAPLAHTIEDARAIASAAKSALSQYFQAGLLYRSDPQRWFLVDFLRAGAAGRPVKARTQWHKKQSLRRASPNPERETELNWRLYHASSPGLIGEFAIHQLDNIAWYLNGRPRAVTGFGSTNLWDDGRETPDTVEAIFEFPRNTRVNCEVSLANSFDSDYEMLFGTDAAIMLRGRKAWMFKEVDAPLLGWEVYARKDTFYQETGIALQAGSTKQDAHGDQVVVESPWVNTPLYFALDAFLHNARVVQATAQDFRDAFGDEDPEALASAIKDASVNNKPAANWNDGYVATVMAVKGNEAVLKRARVEIPRELFEV